MRASPAGADQSRGQCDQVYRRGRSEPGSPRRAGRRRPVPGRVFGQRHRHGDFTQRSSALVPALSAGRRIRHAPAWRNRPGLTISRRLIELKGGEIHVSSILSAGSIFRFGVSPAVQFAGHEQCGRSIGSLPDRLGRERKKVSEPAQAAARGLGRTGRGRDGTDGRDANEDQCCAGGGPRLRLRDRGPGGADAIRSDWSSIPRVLLDFGQSLPEERVALSRSDWRSLSSVHTQGGPD